ncbi:hypothetical protein BDZ45DRAFT_743060 [Acephala macrosclerotiorum]|nr:hypothetical protein BDZ45DRAFT_743060 [Acephala macrosclerotiorum]
MLQVKAEYECHGDYGRSFPRPRMFPQSPIASSRTVGIIDIASNPRTAVPSERLRALILNLGDRDVEENGRSLDQIQKKHDFPASPQLPLYGQTPSTRSLILPTPPVGKIASRHPRSPSHKFYVFAQPPKELRFLIWEAAIPDPRVINLRYRGCSALESRIPRPTLLLACRESFGVMTKFYTKPFGIVLLSASTWFNFPHDALYIDT